MATSLTMMMTMMGGSNPNCSFNNENCDIVVLRDLSSCSDSLFTDPLTPSQSTASATANEDSTAEQCSTNDEISDDNEDDDDTSNFKRNRIRYRNQTHTTTTTTTTTKLTANTATQVTVKEKQRPLSDISIASGDTSGILSPTTAKAILELQKRHQADKLSLLSIAKITYLELLPAGTESSSELETESPDEKMALHLGKKLEQVLNESSESGSDNGNSNVDGSTDKLCLPVQDNLMCCSAITSTTEIFNISKAKKIELPSLSSRLAATTSAIPIPTQTPTAASSATSSHTIDSMDVKHLPILKPAALPMYSTSTSTNSTTSTTAENQSTVIISFKSSQTPVQSQPPFTIETNVYEHTVQHPQQLEQQYATDAITTPLCNNDIIAEIMTHTPPSFPLANNSHSSVTTHMASPICTPRTPKNNVLKKVASFTIEKSATGCANNKVNNGDSNPGIPRQLENISAKRSLWTPKKLHFAVYEKFEGQMLMKWMISSLQSNCNHLSEQDINTLTLQYCNNLVNLGVLKQISEKNDFDSFKPFQMYQWTHTEAPTNLQEHTPGKLDKVSSWTYNSNPLPIPKAIQVDAPQYEKEIQTDELAQTLHEFVCRKCKDNNDYLEQKNIAKLDKGIQVFLNGENNEINQNTSMSAIPPPLPNNSLMTQLPKLQSAFTVLQSPPTPPPPPPTPPPPSMLLTLPPPPPPLPCAAGPPHLQSSSLTSTALTLHTSTVSPPPPPGITKTPFVSWPAPLPNPAEGGWFNQKNTLRKAAVNPPKPMKPLYWTRIVTQPLPPKPPSTISLITSATSDATDSSISSTSPDESITVEAHVAPKEIWQEIDETNLDNIDEFTELFSREAVVPKGIPNVKTQSRAQPTKVLDSRRSQNVGIMLRSSHVDFCEIEHAIYHADTSIVSLETLLQINKNKATNKELELIKEQGDTPLDEPEQFLLKISQISFFTERISCMVLMAEFEETVTVIERKLEVVIQLSQFLMQSEDLKLLFAIILTLGNYMNGGNCQRGQADGFTLEILSKLKDVKSKDSQTTLLHFIVRTYIGRKRKEGVQLVEIPLPIPEPSDVERATQVDFDEVKAQITKLNDQLNAKKHTTEEVITYSTAENTEPFKLKMEEFLKNAFREIEKLFRKLDDCRDVFVDAMKFYHYIPKSVTLEQCTPNKFFEHWTNFTNDFKDIMKKEIASLSNELLKKFKNTRTSKTIKNTKLKSDNLKQRIVMRPNKKL